jgi:hypothetical protein
LISGETTQISSLEGILTATTTTVGLIRQLVDLNKDYLAAQIGYYSEQAASAAADVLSAQTAYSQGASTLSGYESAAITAAQAVTKAAANLTAAKTAYANAPEMYKDIFGTNVGTLSYLPASFVSTLQNIGFLTEYNKSSKLSAVNSAQEALYSAQTAYSTATSNVTTATEELASLAAELSDYQSTYASILQQQAALIAEYESKYGDIPGFASGGLFSGGLRIVGEQGPELELTGPSHIVNASKTEAFMSSNAALLAEIKKLNAKIDRLEAISYQTTKNTQKTAKTLEKFDYDGLPDTRVA